MSRRFNKIAVLKGGPSAEREVSLRSGAAIASALRTKGYDVLEIDVKDRSVDIPSGVEAVFIALHGEFGEDGDVQSLLEKRGIPYTGAGPEASKIAFDKVLTKRILDDKKIPTAPYEVLKINQKRSLALPVVVKPARQGSSIGVSKVAHDAEWDQAMSSACTFDEEVVVERFIEGREFTVGIVGDQVLPMVEIRAPEGDYSYQAKYTRGATEYLVPAPVSHEQTEYCQRIAKACYDALGCRGMGRVDIRMNDLGEAFVLELNTIPGFTETSLLPKAAKAAGIEFADLCEKILNLAKV